MAAKETQNKITVTIRNVLKSDKTYLDNLANTHEINTAEAFAILVNSNKQGANVHENTEQTQQLQQEINTLTESLKTAITEKEAAQAEVLEVKKNIDELENPLKELKKQCEYLENDLKNKIQLTGSQFVCELEEDTAILARKFKKFIKKDDFVNPSSEGQQYANELVNVATKSFIKRHYSHLID